ncbi:MAG: hypothetical protein N2039_01050, partial [Gemmataceae bacterium]|nr:hypothetical protein [Gemmataceae bacterium]
MRGAEFLVISPVYGFLLGLFVRARWALPVWGGSMLLVLSALLLFVRDVDNEMTALTYVAFSTGIVALPGLLGLALGYGLQR